MSALHLLSRPVRDCIVKRGFTELSLVQEQAIPIILAGSHLLLLAPTGTGKTESAMIPIFEMMQQSSSRGFQALYITPLRSLNRDIMSRMLWWCQELGILIGVRHGDTGQAERRRQALLPPDLLVTTPESIQALFLGHRLRESLCQIQYVIIDEIHDLAGTKRGAQLSIALERIVRYSGEFQRIGLSATVGNPDVIGSFLCGDRPFSIIDVPIAKSLLIDVAITGERFSDQVQIVEDKIQESVSTLIFVNTRVTAESLGHALMHRGDVDVHHGSLSRDIRVEAEDRFKQGETKALICTSSMELGIDIGHVGHVLQFGSPREVHRLVQRIGRAGHQIGMVSTGTIIATGFDDLLESLVIKRRALNGEIEDVVPVYRAGDVLANQIAAIAVEAGEINRSDIISIITKSPLYFGEDTLISDICQDLSLHHLIRIDGEKIITTRRARTYLYGNLSMIPDERRFPVYDIVSRRTVGSLDESFVVTYLSTGVVFIARGRLWRVLDMEEGTITVEPARHARGEVPSWEGEQIPVPYAVAHEVGELRRHRTVSSYTDDPIVTTYIQAYFAMLDKNHSVIPTDTCITFEQVDDGVVINICAGHQTNEAIGRILAILISARYGSTVGTDIDAYRIYLRLPSEVRAGTVREILANVQSEHIKPILQLAMKRSDLFKFKLIQTAKKFGVIDPDADYNRIGIRRMADIIEISTIQEETYRELFTRYMDVTHAEEIITNIQQGTISLVLGPVSMIGAAGIFSSHDQIPPPSTDQAVLSTIKHRIMKQDIILACMNCYGWKVRTTVERSPDSPQCSVCGARLIAALKPYEEEIYRTIRKKDKSKEERDAIARLMRNANMVLSSGKKAIIVLSAKGVGPDQASRILGTNTTGDAMYREILKAERNYIKTHRFW